MHFFMPCPAPLPAIHGDRVQRVCELPDLKTGAQERDTYRSSRSFPPIPPASAPESYKDPVLEKTVKNGVSSNQE